MGGRQTDRQTGDLITLLSFLKESRLKMETYRFIGLMDLEKPFDRTHLKSFY
jgi:hypothetical protein